jgi:hypothetical protein
MLHQQRKEAVPKKAKEIISHHIPDGFTVAVIKDESIFVYDALIRRMWTPERKSPILAVTGSYQKTCVFGTLLTIDSKQLFI